MPHALVQTDLNPPTREQFRQAIRVLKQYTEADAIKLARQAYGILMRNLTATDAVLLQQAMTGQGVATAAVDEAELPQIPEPKFTRRVEFQPQALVIYDPIGRTVPVDWQHISGIAAGIVPKVGLAKFETEETQIVIGGPGWVQKQTVTTTAHKLEANMQRLLHILLAGGKMRFEIESEGFLYKLALPDAPADPDQRFAELVRGLIQRAPRASLNRGAAQLQAGAAQPLLYASKPAFTDETAWLVWMAGRKQS